MKIIQYHGWNDQTLQPAYSPDYYDQVMRANGGLEATQNFYRLFMVPGMAHCYVGPGTTSFGAVGQQIPPVRDSTHDVQTALELGRTRCAACSAHRNPFTDDAAATRTVRLKPALPVSNGPTLKGTGDPNDAASFACVPESLHAS